MKSLRQTGHHLQGPLSCLVVGMISEKQFLLNQYSTPVGSAISIQVTCKRLKTRSFTKILQSYSFLQIQCCHVSNVQLSPVQFHTYGSASTLRVSDHKWKITRLMSWCNDVSCKDFFCCSTGYPGRKTSQQTTIYIFVNMVHFVLKWVSMSRV